MSIVIALLSVTLALHSAIPKSFPEDVRASMEQTEKLVNDALPLHRQKAEKFEALKKAVDEFASAKEIRVALSDFFLADIKATTADKPALFQLQASFYVFQSWVKKAKVDSKNTNFYLDWRQGVNDALATDAPDRGEIIEKAVEVIKDAAPQSLPAKFRGPIA